MRVNLHVQPAHAVLDTFRPAKVEGWQNCLPLIKGESISV
jgi:hypothetical protein